MPIQALAAISLLAFLAPSVHAVTLPAVEDTSSAKVGAAQTISKTASAATTLAVNGSTTSPKRALVLFNLADVPTTDSLYAVPMRKSRSRASKESGMPPNCKAALPCVPSKSDKALIFSDN